MSEKVQCPNCLGDAEKSGNKIICATCDAVFKITKTGSATAVELGWKEKIEGRVGALEELLEPEQKPEIGDVEPGGEKDIDDQEESPILPE